MRPSPVLLRPRHLLRILGAVLLLGLTVTAYRLTRPVDLTWEPVTGPAGSYVWAVAVDSTAPETLYAGLNAGGVYKSTDGGLTWQPQNDGLQSLEGAHTGVEHALDVRDLLLSRAHPGTLYAATWGGEGLYASTDGGASWAPEFMDVWSGDPTDSEQLVNSRRYVRVLADNGTDLFAGTQGGVFKQVMGEDGPAWQPTALKGSDRSVRALVIHPTYTQTVYAATLQAGIFRSNDGGLSWQPQNVGLESATARAVNALVLDPAQPAILYAGTWGDGVYRSSDGGAHWSAWNDGLLPGAFVWSLLLTPDGTLFAGLRSGGTFKRAGQGEWQPAAFPYSALTLSRDPRTGALYAGTWGSGLFRDATGQDGTPEAWQALGLPANLPLRLRAAVVRGPAPGTLYVATDSNGVYASPDGGQHWERRSQGLTGPALMVQTLAVGSDGQTLYAGTGAGLFVSADGSRWQPLGAASVKAAATPEPATPSPEFEEPPPTGAISILALAVDRTAPDGDLVYAGTPEGLWRFETGQRQEIVASVLKPETGLVPAVLIQEQTIYASVWGEGLRRSSDRGQHWQPVLWAANVLTGAEETPRYIQSLAHSARRWWQGGGPQLYALTEYGLYGTAGRDSGGWQLLYPGAAGTIAVDPRHPEVAYVGLLTTTVAAEFAPSAVLTPTFGVLVSLNHGQRWANAGALAERPAALVRDPYDPQRIFALLAGGALYRGRVRLPWLPGDVLNGWLLALLGLFLLVVMPYGYGYLRWTYGLSPAQIAGVALHPDLLRRLWSPRFQNRLKPLEKVILATVDRPSFSLVEIWEQLRALGAPASHSQLVEALKDLQDLGLLKEEDETFRYVAPGLQRVAAVEFQPSREALIENVREENRLLAEVARFFEEAGFEVGQDFPRHLTKFVLLPRRPLYRDYPRLHAWVRAEGQLQAAEVEALCRELRASAPAMIPLAFIVVTELPTLEALQRLRTWQNQVRLILLSAWTIRSALREHSALRDLDLLVQQERGKADLYDIRTPIVDPLDFYGRQPARAALATAWSQTPCVDLWGLPGMGKTSFLWHLKETLPGPVVAYADLAYGWQGEALFQEQLLADLSSDLRLKYSVFVETPPGAFEARLAALLSAVPARSVPRIVLLLDGASAANPEPYQALAQLRHLAGSHPGLALVMTWQDSIVTGATWQSLGPLDEKESAELLTTSGIQLGLEFTPEGLAALYRETGGHPRLLRQLGSALLRQLPDRSPTEQVTITAARVEAALPDYRPVREGYFADLWRWWTPAQQATLRTWATLTGEDRARQLTDDPGLRAFLEAAPILAALFTAWLRAASEALP